MPEKQFACEERFNRIETAQKKMLAAATRLESRIDVLNQEFQRTATAVHRLGLARDSAKGAGQGRDEELNGIRDQLARIEALLAGR